MSEEILIRQGAPTLAGIKTGSLFPCPCEDHEALMTDQYFFRHSLSPPLNVYWLAYSNHIALEKPPEGGSSKITDCRRERASWFSAK